MQNYFLVSFWDTFAILITERDPEQVLICAQELEKNLCRNFILVHRVYKVQHFHALFNKTVVWYSY